MDIGPLIENEDLNFRFELKAVVGEKAIGYSHSGRSFVRANIKFSHLLAQVPVA